MLQLKHIFGYHTVLSALKVMPKEIRGIYLQNKQLDNRVDEIIELATKQHIPLKYLTRKEIDAVVPQSNHQGVVAEVIYPGDYTEDHLDLILKNNLDGLVLLILDGVQDPHNLGACLRSANALGASAVVVPKDRACGLTPTVYKVASGAVGITPIIQVTNLARTIETLKKQNVWVYGVDESAAKTISQIEFKPPLALVFGAEGSGLRRLTQEKCDFMLRIPMVGTVPNLNVSVAVGIGLFEVLRQNKPN